MTSPRLDERLPYVSEDELRQALAASRSYTVRILEQGPGECHSIPPIGCGCARFTAPRSVFTIHQSLPGGRRGSTRSTAACGVYWTAIE